jgi:hypothetical protein
MQNPAQEGPTGALPIPDRNELLEVNREEHRLAKGMTLTYHAETTVGRTTHRQSGYIPINATLTLREPDGTQSSVEVSKVIAAIQRKNECELSHHAA